MAKTVIVQTICDRCQAEGKEGVESTSELVFSFDGYAYTLDLCAPHADDFHNTVQTMIAWSSDKERLRESRRARSSPSSPTTGGSAQPARRDKEQIGAIRDWANSNGFKVSNRGRIPAEVEAAYNAAH